MEEQKLSKAEKFYLKHLERMRNYNKAHADVIRERARKQFQKIKEDEVKYKAYLEKKKMKYREQNPKIVLPVKEFE